MLKFLKEQKIKNTNYANPTIRFLAYTIDIFILAGIRYIFAYSLLYLWYSKSFLLFADQLYKKTNVSSLDVDMMVFYNNFISHSIFFETLFFLVLVFLMGPIYWIAAPLTKLGATPGKAIFKIKIVKFDDSALKIQDLFKRYLVGLVPWIFHISMLLALYAKNKSLILACMLLVVFWYEPKILKRSYRAVHDLICGTKVVKKKP
ncbi:MAG: hypothetical protein HOH73_00450 [Alphaproteobacteria bacterium]|jgi:uncharacterized RDD family membrane protein YckC|nr:hypothetical protein [Alphaproteobacteria bacterium]